MNKEFMLEAIKLSVDSVEKGGGPFGAVIVKDGEIIARASNSVTNTNDPTAHAEVNAIRLATKELSNFELQGCEIYTSCEPCPMCLGAIYWARLDKIYFANNKADAKDAGFDDSFIYEEIDVPIEKRKIPTIQILSDEAQVAFDKWKKLENKTEY